MKFKELEGFAFDKESKVLGAVASVDFLEQTMKILTDEEVVVVAELENVVILEKVGYIGDEGIVNHDVLTGANGNLYEIELQEDGDIKLYSLDKKLQRTDEKGEVLPIEQLDTLGRYLKLVGNLYELEPEEDLIKFNIVIVRTKIDGEIGYSYACNNVEKEEIDLIKVVFIGSQLLEEEIYNRETVSYEEYLKLVEDGTLKEVSPNELMNYVTGVTYGRSGGISGGTINGAALILDEELEELEEMKKKSKETEEDFVLCECPSCRLKRVEDEEDEDYCDECGEHNLECDCKGW